MKRRLLFPRSMYGQPVAVAVWATRRARVKRISTALPTAKPLQQTRSANVKDTHVRLGLVITILMACFACPADAITLETVLQTTLEKNPDDEAKTYVRVF